MQNCIMTLFKLWPTQSKTKIHERQTNHQKAILFNLSPLFVLLDHHKGDGCLGNTVHSPFLLCHLFPSYPTHAVASLSSEILGTTVSSATLCTTYLSTLFTFCIK